MHLRACDDAFLPPLSSRVDICDYAQKIADKAQRFEACVNDKLVGLVAVYVNTPDRGSAFITSVSVLPGCQGRGIASRLMEDCITHVRVLGFARLELEVGRNNAPAIALYGKHGFTALNQSGAMLKMVVDF